MKVYFVRHGETELNSKKMHQTSDTPLGKNGESQAKFVGERFRSIKIDKIIASSYTRAHQTAMEIEKATGKELILSDLFIERKNPSLYQGKLHDEPSLEPTKKLIESKMDDPLFHHSDEENFHDILKRADNAISFIIDQKVENLAVVSHGFFLIAIISRMIFQDTLAPSVFRRYHDGVKHTNTGISVLEYIDNKWRILTLNDYAHLGE